MSLFNTPLIRINSLSNATGCEILAKVEYENKGGSVKDRPALYMISAGEKSGLLLPGGWIVEGTAGNTGFGLLHFAKEKGYKCLFCCPESVSVEKIDALKSLGAEIVMCPCVSVDHDDHFQNVAKRKAVELNGYYTNQFYNEYNHVAHYETTGPEIWTQTNGKVNALITSAGTGGTIAGCSTYLKEQNPDIKCYLIDVQGQSVILDRDEKNDLKLRLKKPEEKIDNGSTVMEGIGSSKLYYPLTFANLDDLVFINDIAGVKMCEYLLENDNLNIGGSSGINCVGAYLTAKRLGPGNTIVTFLCDSGDRYKSKIFNKDWLIEKNLYTDVDCLKFLEQLIERGELKIM
jgi:cysteine synthase A